MTFIKFLLMCFFGGVSILSGLLSVAYAADLLSKYIQVVINTLVKWGEKWIKQKQNVYLVNQHIPIVKNVAVYVKNRAMASKGVD